MIHSPRFIALLAAVLFALPLLTVRADPVPPLSPPPTAGWEAEMVEVVVEIEDGQNPREYASYFLLQLGVPLYEVKRRVTHVYEHALTGFAVLLTPSEADRVDGMFSPGEFGVERLVADVQFTVPEVDSANFTPQASAFPGGATALLLPTNLSRTSTGLPDDPGQYSGVDVAVIDTGIDARHPLLNVVGGIDCTAGPSDRDSFGVDPYGHGTHVAGTIAARFSEQGIVGFAPGARLWDVRVLDASGGGTMGSILCGIEFVAMQGIPVANMSLGGSLPPSDCDEFDPLHTAVCRATESGVIFVVAAGNGGEDAESQVPASYPEVVTVAALADFNGVPGGGGLAPADSCGSYAVDDALAPWSNFGEAVDLAAPGVCVLSTLPGEVGDTGMYEPQYGHYSGTSMATPAVTGAIARWIAVHPGDDQQSGAVQAVIEHSLRHGDLVAQPSPALDPLPVLFVGDGAPEWRDGFRPPLPAPKNVQLVAPMEDMDGFGQWCKKC
jgi:subtilisin